MGEGREETPTLRVQVPRVDRMETQPVQPLPSEVQVVEDISISPAPWKGLSPRAAAVVQLFSRV